MLTFNLKKEWFEKIKSGEKTHEYRKHNLYWTSRLYRYYIAKRHYEPLLCVFCLGYPKVDDREKRLLAKVKDITIKRGIDTDLKINELVYDIEFELIKEYQ